MITQKEIDYIIDQKTPFLIKNKKGKWIFPFKSIEAQKQVIEHLKKGVYEKISKLSQHDVIKNEVAVCEHKETENLYCEVGWSIEGKRCKKCKQTVL